MKRTMNVKSAKKRVSLVKLVDQLIAKGMKALATGKLKVTVADLIRIRERLKELAPKPPLTAEVTWTERPD
jgi:hypothetical protein